MLRARPGLPMLADVTHSDWCTAQELRHAISIGIDLVGGAIFLQGFVPFAFGGTPPRPGTCALRSSVNPRPAACERSLLPVLDFELAEAIKLGQAHSPAEPRILHREVGIGPDERLPKNETVIHNLCRIVHGTGPHRRATPPATLLNLLRLAKGRVGAKHHVFARLLLPLDGASTRLGLGWVGGSRRNS